VWPYAYSPLIALVFVPALWLPWSIVRAGWWMVNAACLVVGSWLVVRAMRPAEGTAGLAARLGYLPAAATLALVFLYRFDPAVVAMRLGQIEIVQFLLLAATLDALRQRRDGLAGVALGIAAGLKFIPLALVALLLWRGRWRAAAWAIAVALITVVGAFALVGLGTVPAYLDYTSIYGVGGAFAAFPLNQSLNAFFSRNLVRNVFSASLAGIDLPWLARALTLACSAFGAWLTWRPAPKTLPQDQEGRRLGLEFALAVAALLLISPHSQVYTFVWSLLSLGALGAWLLVDRRARHFDSAFRGAHGWPWAGLAIVYLLIGRSYALYYPGVTRLVQSHYFLGALGLWAIIGAILWRERRLEHQVRRAGA
jgi:hypothetical protein